MEFLGVLFICFGVLFVPKGSQCSCPFWHELGSLILAFPSRAVWEHQKGCAGGLGCTKKKKLCVEFRSGITSALTPCLSQTRWKQLSLNSSCLQSVLPISPPRYKSGKETKATSWPLMSDIHLLPKWVLWSSSAASEWGPLLILQTPPCSPKLFPFSCGTWYLSQSTLKVFLEQAQPEEAVEDEVLTAACSLGHPLGSVFRTGCWR